VDLIVSPTTVALNPQQSTAVPALKAGDIIEAKVLELLGQSIARLAVGKSIIEVQTQVPLTPGTTVRLAVKNTPDGIRLTLLPPAPHAGNAPGSSGPAASVVPQGAAPAMAGESAGAAAQPLTTGTGAIAGGNPNNPATITLSTAAPDPLLPTQPQAPNPAVAAQTAVAAAVQSSAARQGGLAPLLADAEVATTVPALPEPVRQAAERLLALQPALDETISADSLKQALGRSGLFLEAHLASAANGAMPTAPRGAMPVPVDDVKAALIVLRNVLKTWLAADPSVGQRSGAVPRPAALAELARAALAALPHGTAPSAAAPDDAHDAAPRVSAPPPPYRGAPTAAQPAAAPSISADMTPRDIGKVLLGETDAAIARQTLLQAASLPDHRAASAANGGTHVDMRVDPTGSRWLFEVPFATPQGSTVAQFEIARDGHRGPADAAKPAWRARFSLDLDPIGPVHAQIALTGARAAVTLWAERPDTSARLRDNAGQLAEALRQAELEPGEVLVRAGTPPRPPGPAASGRFLDRAS
jgi:flagellar hook-length control protein FliK